jgi:hypothetical protein
MVRLDRLDPVRDTVRAARECSHATGPSQPSLEFARLVIERRKLTSAPISSSLYLLRVLRHGDT